MALLQVWDSPSKQHEPLYCVWAHAHRVHAGLSPNERRSAGGQHLPFLVGVPEILVVFQIVSLNEFGRAVTGFDVLGAVRVVPETDSTCVLVLRQTVPAVQLTRDWLFWYVDRLVKAATNLHNYLLPALGGRALPAEA